MTLLISFGKCWYIPFSANICLLLKRHMFQIATAPPAFIFWEIEQLFQTSYWYLVKEEKLQSSSKSQAKRFSKGSLSPQKRMNFRRISEQSLTPPPPPAPPLFWVKTLRFPNLGLDDCFQRKIKKQNKALDVDAISNFTHPFLISPSILRVVVSNVCHPR